MFCDDSCAGVIPAYGPDTCNVNTRKGGIRKLIFAVCNIDFTDITDLAEWTAKITANEVRPTGEILGSKPKGSPTAKKVASCLPEVITGFDKQINVKDFNADDVAFTDYDFWKWVAENQKSLVVGYVTCDDLFYGWIPDFTLEHDDEREEDVNDNTFHDIIIKYKEKYVLKPQLITGLNSVLI